MSEQNPSHYCECCLDHVCEPVKLYSFPDNSVIQLCDSCAKFNL